MLRTVLVLTFLPSLALPVAAASSGWVETEGGAVRIVTSGLSDEAGHLRGALEIRLGPGWKTYWRDPGDAGIPPQIELSATSDATAAKLHFPAPERISTDYATWAGYRHPVALPVVFTFSAPGSAGIVEGTVFVGICETICIPVEAPFSFDAGVGADNPQDALTVETAFAGLPAAPDRDFRISAVTREGDRLLFQADLPQEAGEPGLFLAAPEGVQIDVPALQRRDGRSAIFSAEIRGPVPDGSVSLDYTLTTGEEAVSGTIPLPRN